MVFNYKRLLERLDLNIKQFKNASSKTPELFKQHQILLKSNLNKKQCYLIINCMWMVHNVKVFLTPHFYSNKICNCNTYGSNIIFRYDYLRTR